MASGNTSKSKSPLQVVLASVPTQSRSRIIKPFLDVKKRLAEASGKLCESGLRLNAGVESLRVVMPRALVFIYTLRNKRQDLDFKQQVLLCYQEPGNSLLQEELFSWVEHSNFTVFKRSVLEQLHKKRLIEYDKAADAVTISPLGIKEVEERILKPAVS